MEAVEEDGALEEDSFDEDSLEEDSGKEEESDEEDARVEEVELFEEEKGTEEEDKTVGLVQALRAKKNAPKRRTKGLGSAPFFIEYHPAA